MAIITWTRFHFQRSRKTENENGLRIPFFDGVGKRKTKLEVPIAAPAVIASSFTDLFTS